VRLAGFQVNEAKPIKAALVATVKLTMSLHWGKADFTPARAEVCF
jgi:hypothetical protein